MDRKSDREREEEEFNLASFVAGDKQSCVHVTVALLGWFLYYKARNNLFDRMGELLPADECGPATDIAVRAMQDQAKGQSKTAAALLQDLRETVIPYLAMLSGEHNGVPCDRDVTSEFDEEEGHDEA